MRAVKNHGARYLEGQRVGASDLVALNVYYWYIFYTSKLYQVPAGAVRASGDQREPQEIQELQQD